MLNDAELDRFFPTDFLKATHAVHGEDAKTKLKGIISSINSTSLSTEVAAMSYIKKLGLRPFLNESQLQSVVYNLPSGQQGKVVDFVAMTAAGDGLLVVEAKGRLVSSELKKDSVLRKFAETMEGLRAYYERGGVKCPPMRRAVLTTTREDISDASRWGVEGGKLTKHEELVTVGVLGVPIEVVEV